MIIVIKDSIVIATHENIQKSELSLSMYPGADSFKMISVRANVGDTDPTIATPAVLIQSYEIMEAAADWAESMPTFATVTTTEAQAWIENTVTDLATAKEALKKMVKAIILLRDRTK